MRPGLIVMWLIQLAVFVALLCAVFYICFGLAGLK